ncbi:microprocessor complex subunit DGCR8-like [Liolophura sinensis]|uniref:microprocessor complex subunit DGCR8-like n=1 Tax=Liolophura sinensis TaxID=3198878 RepID=UPI0031587F10
MAEGLDFDSDGGGPIPQGTLMEDTESAAKRPRLETVENSDALDSDCPSTSNNMVALSYCDSDSAGVLQTRDLEIIDELAGDQDGVEDFDEDSEGSECDLDDDEIHAWLEEGIELGKKSQSEGENKGEATGAPIRRDKVVLKERGHDPFEFLPEGWVTVTHNSGMPVYLHKRSRVCTLSKPYFLGPGSARKHEIPVSAVPCLHYRKELEKEKGVEAEEMGVANDAGGDMQGNETDSVGERQSNGQHTTNGELPESTKPSDTSPSIPVNESLTNGPSAPPPPADGATEDPGGTSEAGSAAVPVKIEYAEERKKITSLGPMELRNYCKNLFEFRVITVKKFKTWKDRRRHHTLMKRQNRPGLPDNTRLITCPIPSERGDDKKKEFALNPSGKSFVCILHEYVQHAMRVQPKYIFKELENAQTPYSATVVINDVEYATGYASSKKAAKMDAAKSTLAILIPEMKKVTQQENSKETEDLSFFDEIKIEDPRIYELCSKAGQPSPYQILQECLKRNYGMGDTQCKMEMKPLKHQRNEFLMSVGKHEAKVVCKNKREGKQSAAQAILQLLHPHVQSWGSLLRLYGRGSCNAIREKKQEEQSITHLQVNAKANRPNTAVLDKLKVEMTKLQQQRESIQSIGTFRVSTQELPANVASINL